ncbi:hypothetical protein [Pseudomonas sp. CC120222-01a]|uniref:hypothetical protein n=1 Tax=Pseudomonas sp. CC120222-01a TaxID=1378075 RepID=UPI0021139825|nr:hypothetical protein [Pseudomonas sp. CC120222-01a]
MKRFVELFWGGMDAFYIFFVVLGSFNRGVTPFVSDFKSALESMEHWGGGLEFMVWMGLVAQVSIIASSLLLFLGRVSGVYLAAIQLPFRVFFVIPSFALILLLPDVSTWVWLSLIAASEGAKAWSLWWLWRRRG